jgi:hypothetical protein
MPEEPELEAMLRQMAAYYARNELNGWESTDMRYWSRRIMKTLLDLADLLARRRLSSHYKHPKLCDDPSSPCA